MQHSTSIQLVNVSNSDNVCATQRFAILIRFLQAALCRKPRPPTPAIAQVWHPRVFVVLALIISISGSSSHNLGSGRDNVTGCCGAIGLAACAG